MTMSVKISNITVTFNQDANAQQKERTLISLKYLKTTLD